MSTPSDTQAGSKSEAGENSPSGGVLVRRYAELLAIIAILFVAQTGLVPYDFALGVPIGANASRVDTSTQASFPDLVSNIFLYVPLGMLLHWAMVRRLRSAAVAWLATIVLSLILSAGIEWAQAYSPTRVSTLRDVLANITGAALGASFSWVARLALPRVIDSALHAVRDRPKTALLNAYCVALVVFAAMPFSFSFDTTRIKKAVKSTHLVPFRADTIDRALTDDILAKGDHFAATHLEWQRMKRWSRWSAETASFFLLAWLVLPALRGDYQFTRRATTLLAIWIGGALAVGLSALQFTVVSRACDVTDVMFRLLGLGIGLIVASARGSRRSQAVVDSVGRPWRGLARAGCALSAVFILYNGLIPATFDAGSSGPTTSLESAAFLPFFGYYPSRFDLMMDDVMEKLASYAVFAACLTWSLSCLRLKASKVPLWPAVAASLFIAASIEAAQMFITVRYCSLTDLMIAAGGCVVGVGALQQFVVFQQYASTQILLPSDARIPLRHRRLAPADALVASLADPHAGAPTEPEPTDRPVPRS